MREVVIYHNGHRITSERQALCLTFLSNRRGYGATSKEIEATTGQHHGKISGALSALHEKGFVTLLKEKRDHYKVYVLAEYVAGRECVSRVSYKERAEVAEKRVQVLVRYLDATDPNWRAKGTSVLAN